MSLDIELLADTTVKIVDRMHQELANLAKSHGTQFASSVMLSVCGDIAGASLASAKDDGVRESGYIAFGMAVKKSMAKYSADYATQDLIEKVKA